MDEKVEQSVRNAFRTALMLQNTPSEGEIAIAVENLLELLRTTHAESYQRGVSKGIELSNDAIKNSFNGSV